MEERAQGAIEYLLLIAAAVVVVAVVVGMMIGLLTTGGDQATNAGSDYNGQLNDLNKLKRP
ncbi:MAG: class III signal peptide-containing protein [archaeon]|jgi:hypothetical protein